MGGFLAVALVVVAMGIRLEGRIVGIRGVAVRTALRTVRRPVPAAAPVRCQATLSMRAQHSPGRPVLRSLHETLELQTYLAYLLGEFPDLTE
ncbi:MAG TPA: hypothetical protein VHI98_01430 [Vicinamibacterales bacterium]|nr:hypothetical protein [Vicinamibacterales bacterium]